MKAYRFGACEHTFPCWGALAVQMAHEAGFEGIQLADAGGYLQPHPGNSGYVEYERYGLDLRRKDSFPLTFRRVQEDYLEAAASWQMELVSIYLYTLEYQGFIKYSKNTPQGGQCLESIRSGVAAAEQMGIPSITIAVKGTFGTAQNQYALENLRYAVEQGECHGVRIAVSTDLAPDAVRLLLDAFDGKVKLAMDTYTPLICTSDIPVDLIRSFGAEPVDHFRVRDFPPDKEGFPATEEASLLGQGIARFAEAAQAVQDTGYTGWIFSDTPYYHPKLQAPGEDYVSLARRDVHALQTAFRSKTESAGEDMI